MTSTAGDNPWAKAVRDHLDARALTALLLKREYPPPKDAARYAAGAFGGTSRLPEDIEWPRSEVTDKPLALLAEIDLGSLPAFNQRGLLPAKGGLFAFLDMTHEEALYGEIGGRVIWSPSRLDDHPARTLPADAPRLYDEGGDQKHIKAYPRFPLIPLQLKTYVFELPPGAPREASEAWAAVSDYRAKAEKAAAIKALGMPDPSLRYTKSPSSLASTLMPTFRDAVSRGELQFPDDAWPYTWIFTDAVIGSFWGDPRAQSWSDLFQSSDPGQPLSKAQHATFRDWCRSMLPADKWGWESRLGDSLMEGHTSLMALNPKWRELLPPRIIEAMRGYHATMDAFEDGSDHINVVRHQLLGHPDAIQDDARELAKTHVMLLQIDSDYGMGWIWGDVGNLQFWISPEDLAAGNFDQVGITLMCT